MSSFYTYNPTNENSFIGQGTATSDINELKGRLDFLESGVLYDGTNITLNGNDIVTSGNVSVANDLDVLNNVSCGRLFISGGNNTNTYLDATEVQYLQPVVGTPTETSLFFIEETQGGVEATLQPYRMINFQNTSNINNVFTATATSSRVVYNLTRNGAQTVEFRLTLPKISGYNRNIPLDHDFLICKLNDPPQNITITIGGFDQSGNETTTRFCMAKERRYDTSGNLILATSQIITGNVTNTLSSFKGEVFLNFKSCGDGIDGDGAFIADVEIFDKP